jgi:hypothetical protein
MTALRRRICGFEYRLEVEFSRKSSMPPLDFPENRPCFHRNALFFHEVKVHSRQRINSDPKPPLAKASFGDRS